MQYNQKGFLIPKQICKFMMTWLTLTSPCFCNEVDSAQQEHAHSAFNYYKALRALGHQPTSQEITDLAAKIYTPTQIELERAIQEQTQLQSKAHPKVPLHFESKPTDPSLNSRNLTSNSRSSPSPSPGSTSRVILPQPPKTDTTAPVVIDGSQFPKVLTFPGKSPGPSPKPSSSPRLPSQPARTKAPYIN